MHKGEPLTKMAKGGSCGPDGYAMGGAKKPMASDRPMRKQYPTDRGEPMIKAMAGGMIKNRGTLGVDGNKNPGETKMHTAPDLPGPKTMMKRGGMTPKQEAKVGKVMGEFKAGDLHSGSKSGPMVKSRKQAVAIAMSEAGKKRK